MAEPKNGAQPKSMPTNMERLYRETVVPAMMKKFNYKNVHEVPRLVKCSINMGVGKATEDIKVLEDAAQELTLIAGQKAVYTRARKAISNFKIKEGQAIGCRVTLRRRMMYEFVDRLINVALPRIRDFRGASQRSFDAKGNYTIGIHEQNIFPEVVSDKVARTQGMDITLVTTARTQAEALYLLYLLGMPFRDRDEKLVMN